MSSPYTSGYYALQFFDENTGWVCGDSARLLKTTNGGVNFISVNSNSQSYITDICFANQNTGWYSSGDKKIYKTINGGLNWFVPHSNTFNAGIGAVNFVNENRGICFTYDNKILLTLNGGNDWTEHSLPAGKYINYVYGTDALNFWAIGDYGFIYHTSDGGHSWLEDNKK
ncbi:MAG: hypothetical protein IPH77_16530 [Ignavibacteria bacterium]|nr:hypothetical protein [Ignavibacteria bacterium]